MGKYYKWDKNDKELLKLYWDKLKKEDIQKIFPTVKWHSIEMVALRMGLKNNNINKRKGTLLPLLQENNIAYYWMGFIMADGWIASKTGQLVIGLSEKDKNHLEKLAILLNTTVKTINIKSTKIKRKPLVRIAVADKKLGIMLKEKMNINEKKTLNPPNLNFLKTTEQFISFLLGFIDGDGCITIPCKNAISLRIGCHINWFNNLQEIKNKLLLLLPESHINLKICNTRNYALLSTYNWELLKLLKQFAILNQLPIMERKWNKIII